MKLKETLRRKTKGKKGFTLVELVIVIAVLAIIAAIAIPTVSNVIGNANAAADASNAQSIELAIKTAQAEVAAYNTNKSSKVTNSTSAGGLGLTATNGAVSGTVSLTDLLKAYGVDISVVTDPKVTNNKFVYDSTTGKVTLATSADATKVTVLSKNTNCVFAADGTLTIS